MPPAYLALSILMFAVAATVVAVLFLRQRQRLAGIGEFLGGGSDGSSAWGSSLGVRATLRLERRSRDDKQPWTEVSAELPAKLPFVMALRSQGWVARRRIARGTLVDVIVGDATFDAAYVIEAAPADVVRALLTPARRAALAGFREIELCTEPGPTPRLRLRVPALLDDLQSARPALALVVDLATGVRDAYAQVEAAAERPLVGAPFRQHEDDRAAQEAARQREAEVRHLQAKRAGAFSLAPMVLFAVAAWGAGLIALWWASMYW